MLELPVDQSVSSESLTTVSEMIRRGELSNSLDMSGSISARIRRRQKMPVIYQKNVEKNTQKMTTV